MNNLEIGSEERPDDLGRIQKHEDKIQVSLSPGRFVALLEEIMGEKEVLAWNREYSFVANTNDLAQFHHLLSEKIRTQSRASLSLFSAELACSDGSSRTITTFAALERLYEHRDVQATAISMRWEVLVDLGSERPLQRQVVRLDLSTSSAGGSANITKAGVRIEHTHPLWASEVLDIYQKQLQKIAVEYSSLYRALIWYSKYIRTALLAVCGFAAFGLGIAYLSSGRTAEDYWDSNEQFMYALSTAVGKAEDIKKPEVLAQFAFVLYVLGHPNAKVTKNLIGRLRNLDYFGPEMEAVFQRASDGEFDKPVILDSDFRRAFVTATAAFVFLTVFSVLAALYLRVFKSPGFLLMTDASTTAHRRFLESRSQAREIVFHVLAVAIAGACGKAAVYSLEIGAIVLSR